MGEVSGRTWPDAFLLRDNEVHGEIAAESAPVSTSMVDGQVWIPLQNRTCAPWSTLLAMLAGLAG